MLKGLWGRVRGAGPGSRTLQEDLDLYRALLLVRLRNRDSEAVEETGLELQAAGRGAWSRLLREELATQLDPLMAHVASLGGQDPYPVPKRKERTRETPGKQATPLEAAIGVMERDLDIEERPATHPTGGWAVRIARSSVTHPEAGLGVMMTRRARAGELLMLYPGRLWWPGTYAGPQRNDYAISRYDGVVIDALHWDRLAREEALEREALMRGLGARPGSAGAGIDRFRNPFAIGSFVNHPPLGATANVLAVPVAFSREQLFVPHEVASPSRPLHLFADHRDEVPGLALIAARNVEDEELFLNYRLNPALPFPDWYHQPDPEEAARRWAKHSFFSLS